MTGRIPLHICASACRFPEADTPAELWDNVLNGRRAFRNIPPERLPLDAYTAEVIGEADSITPIKAALLRDYKFDREKFRVPRSVFEATDLAHWLALDVANEAVNAAGGLDKLDAERTAVIVGNTLTGEFSRAASLRGRLPFVEGLIHEAADKSGLDKSDRDRLAQTFADIYRDSFPAPNEDSLAGGLANTIAGRISNHFDFKGGAYTVDGACASSLLAVCNACDLIVGGRADFALVGAVDLSLDPFELVGFSRNGALAREDMRVFDEIPTGFWPGEGCGFIVLAHPDAAREHGLRPEGSIIGWGQSTDGRGGLTRPEIKGQALAIQRALQMASIDPDTVAYVEAHGTGTAIGDPTEINALAEAYPKRTRPLAIGSVKANIGHTKAAAGMAGMIKALFAARQRILPPHIGYRRPSPLFNDLDGVVTAPSDPQPWATKGAARAGVSSFGFGGVNTHVILETTDTGPEPTSSPVRTRCIRQDAELFVFAAATPQALAPQIGAIASLAESISLSEMTDLSAALWHDVTEITEGWRAAVIASGPDELRDRLGILLQRLNLGEPAFDPAQGIFLDLLQDAPKIGFLFPGQAAPSRVDGGMWPRNFDGVTDIVHKLADVPADSPSDTWIAQPAILGASLAGLRLLRRFGIEASAAVGHSVGELTALAWSGALDETNLLPLAASRGAVMAKFGEPDGGMVRSTLDVEQAVAAAEVYGLECACENSPSETVLAGPLDAIAAFTTAASDSAGCLALPVSHAFHSRMMAPVKPAFKSIVDGIKFSAVKRAVCSTVSGDWLTAESDLPAILTDQLTAPVKFSQALEAIGKRASLLIEVGPGNGLSRLAAKHGHLALSVDAFADDIRGLLNVLGAVYVAGGAVEIGQLFNNRAPRPFRFARPKLLTNICGAPAADRRTDRTAPALPVQVPDLTAPGAAFNPGYDDIETLVHHAVGDMTGLSAESVTNELSFLGDLKLTSIRVGELVTGVCRSVGIELAGAPTDFAAAKVGDLVTMLESAETKAPVTAMPEGIAPWIECFDVVWEPCAPVDGPRTAWHGMTFGTVGSANATMAELVAEHAAESRHLVLYLTNRWTMRDLDLLFDACKSAAEGRHVRHLTIVHHGAPVDAFFKSVYLEGHIESVRIITVPNDTSNILPHVSQDIDTAGSGFLAYRFTGAGNRRRELLVRADLPATKSHLLGSGDVILVTGGSHGIGLECGLRWARESGAHLILIGRRRRKETGVAAILERCRSSAIDATYISADVTDKVSLDAAIERVTARTGPITSILHAAGVNAPKSLTAMTSLDLRDTISPKVAGLRNVLDCIDTTRLKAIIAFGSIIGVTGMDGEAHYALANEMLRHEMSRVARPLRGTLLQTINWSVWNGVGQGDADTVERLRRRAVTPLPVDGALETFCRIVNGTGTGGSIVVSSRFGPPPTVHLAKPNGVPLRFIDDIKVYYPGIELIADTEISFARDPYLADHIVDGDSVFPGVMALEAIGQAAMTLTGSTNIIGFDDVEFRSPILIPKGASRRIRTTALRLDGGSVEVRISDSGNNRAAVRAVCVFGEQTMDLKEIEVGRNGTTDAIDLYGRLYFNDGRFRRISRLNHIGAHATTGDLTQIRTDTWFNEYAPARLLLGDPGARDAMIHGLQVCVPSARVLPTSVQRIRFRTPGKHPPICRFAGRETTLDGSSFNFDIVGRDKKGNVIERWEGARFTVMPGNVIDTRGLPVNVLPALIERRAGDLLSAKEIQAGVCNGQARSRAARRTQALRMAGIEGDVSHRQDGRPEIAVSDHPAKQISISHADTLTCVVSSNAVIGCDIEWLPEDESRADQLIDRRDVPFVENLVNQTGSTKVRATYIVWSIREALKKAGCIDVTPLLLREFTDDHWIAIETGRFQAAGGFWQDRLAIAVAVADGDPERASEEI